VDVAGLERVVRERLGRRVASIEAIPAGMGTRRFHRLRLEGDAPVALIARSEAGPDAPAPGGVAVGSATGAPRVALPPAPAWLPEPPLEPLRGFLEEAGLRVPRSYGHFPELGLDLLEDVGSRNLLAVDRAERERAYRAACGIVPRLQALSAPPGRIPAFGRRYDRALVETKRWKWIHWAIPGLLGRAARRDEIDASRALFDAIADLLEAAPRRLAHRDFKAENLHLPSAAPFELVLIDVQGAFMAPPEYDLVCLLYDLQTDLPEALAAELFEATRPALPDRPAGDEARLRFDAIAVTRLAKDVAHVIHAGVARGDLRRWAEIPRGLELLGRAAGRLEGRFPGVETLNSVILALTRALASTDIAGEGSAR